ncbi:LysR family transcriptional regulator [Nocardioides mangrovi]|uniref:LysR family transcriptional regulator n=1 Tax=Nocardioides mangrovi TaxID=2874580 RepID=A0ABS7U6F6_9ACTN|nr:LysR family transcriptional regulator [Nocardioides mangrovi]MBZ5736563.1 LysR family transcriptional regulator [Nocardioides mangrovi]
MDDPSLRDLRAFVAVVDHATFTDAAIELGVSQASVSRAVARLESSLGVPLLRRTSRSVSLTPAGRTSLVHARAVLDEVDLLRRSLREPATTMRLGYAWAALGRHTAVVQQRWRQEQPDTQLELVHSWSATSGLVDGLVDVAIVRTEVTDPRIESSVVGFENRYLAISSDDPLAQRRFVRLGDLDGRVVAVDPRTGSTRQPLLDVATSTLDVRGVEEWLNVIASGRAVGITAEATKWVHARPGVAYRPVRDADPVAVRLVWWQDSPPPGRAALLQILREAYAR